MSDSNLFREESPKEDDSILWKILSLFLLLGVGFCKFCSILAPSEEEKSG